MTFLLYFGDPQEKKDKSDPPSVQEIGSSVMEERFAECEYDNSVPSPHTCLNIAIRLVYEQVRTWK